MQDLKEVNEQMKINVPYRVALLDSQIPNKYKAVVMQKLNILKSMDPSDNEYYKIKHWVDAFMKIPFGKSIWNNPVENLKKKALCPLRKYNTSENVPSHWKNVLGIPFERIHLNKMF